MSELMKDLTQMEQQQQTGMGMDGTDGFLEGLTGDGEDMDENEMKMLQNLLGGAFGPKK